MVPTHTPWGLELQAEARLRLYVWIEDQVGSLRLGRPPGACWFLHPEGLAPTESARYPGVSEPSPLEEFRSP